MARIEGVLFDAGNTLLRVATSVGDIYARVAAAHGLRAAPQALEAAFRRVYFRRKEGFLPAVSLARHTPERERAWWRAVVVETFREGGAPWKDETALDAYFDELYATFERADVWRLFPDAEPALDELAARGLPLAVVSNWDSRLPTVLAALGLSPRFRFVLVSAECGIEKPDPRIFRLAAERMGSAPDRLLYVGDLWPEDVKGPQAAGMPALWIDRDGGGEGAGRPERIASLTEIAKRIL